MSISKATKKRTASIRSDENEVRKSELTHLEPLVCKSASVATTLRSDQWSVRLRVIFSGQTVGRSFNFENSVSRSSLESFDSRADFKDDVCEIFFIFSVGEVSSSLSVGLFSNSKEPFSGGSLKVALRMLLGLKEGRKVEKNEGAPWVGRGQKGFD